jgi:hypothetical protein
MRISDTALALALVSAGCSPAGADQAEPIEQAETVPCAIDGATEFAACPVERSAGEAGEDILVIRHPGGGFRRLTLSAQGELAAADGADEAVGQRRGDALEVTIAGDRYRFPAESDDSLQP